MGRRGVVRTSKGDHKGFLKVLKQIWHLFKGYKVWIYVDRAPWHKGDEVREFIIRHKELRLKYLPAYQPGLNQQERVWRQVRYEATTNQWFEDIEDIWEAVVDNFQHWSPKKVKQLCNMN